MRLDHVQLAAPPGSEEQARRFYGSLIGLHEVAKPEALRSRGGVWFALDAEQQLHIGTEQQFAPARKAHPALSVGLRELDELAARFAKEGLDVIWDETIPTVRRFHVGDPWGNRLEFLSSG